MSEAIQQTELQRFGAWSWLTKQVAAEYCELAGTSFPVEDKPTTPRNGKGSSSSGAGPEPARGRSPRGSKRARSQSTSRGDRGAKAARSADQPATHTVKGRPFCLAFNNGKCQAGRQCPQDHLHACNFVDANGKTCGWTAHRRVDHPRR